MTDHTPLPWRVSDDGKHIFKGGDCICSCDTDNASEGRMRANAAYIVKACNAYPALIDLLERARFFLNNSTAYNPHMAGEISETLAKLEPTNGTP